ncbi:hypothetical protein L484_026145 [Morus notabilis]|uniref:Uncharacterized protein n=1 Tax=Morus notabilis TaxID=981085 RepID=W9R878_9ROSA|nr:hypothetical protein L484_026145 [Morus notabilis]
MSDEKDGEKVDRRLLSMEAEFKLKDGKIGFCHKPNVDGLAKALHQAVCAELDALVDLINTPIVKWQKSEIHLG